MSRYFAGSQDMTATSTSLVTNQPGNDSSGNSIITMISPLHRWVVSCEGDNWVCLGRKPAADGNTDTNADTNMDICVGTNTAANT